MVFRRGDQVEVASQEEGFKGSYYTATVISELLNKKYILQFKTLLKDDLSGPLREIVDADDVRPAPPVIPVTGFGLYDKVDAFDNDGWWVGKITGKIGNKFFVYFETSGDEIAYQLKNLRVHQDYLNGKWFCSRKGVSYESLYR